MSLFDDILPQNKPTPPTGGNPPVQDDPLVTPQITITESTPIDITPSTPVSTPVENITDTPTPVEKIPVDTSGILIIDESSTDNIVSPSAVSPVVDTQFSEVAPTSGSPASMTSASLIPDSPSSPDTNLFSLVSETPVSESLISTSPVSASSDISPTASDLSTTTIPKFQTTEDLIAHEISDLDEFILSLDEVDHIKLEEEATYKKQKEHFAELELQADAEHQKILTERAHAEKMKAYLEEEIQGDHIEKVTTKKSVKSLV